ncbi:MAG TPA: hypothetical protein VGG29_05275 [Caulobacteraceae bacterium]
MVINAPEGSAEHRPAQARPSVQEGAARSAHEEWLAAPAGDESQKTPAEPEEEPCL